MKLCPSNNEALLAPRKGASQTLDLADIIDSHMVLGLRPIDWREKLRI